ncbi:hypothetical protein [Isoptericola croceus]|uniref:hypothetical protein n=1 Tax=Isoptericola croceus TaxID=3031406 RepID=UPI0023F72FA8|nr:hypothetical protein [Isoptericola croceus]
MNTEVMWQDGQPPAGEFVDDPRAQALYNYTLWANASANAFNYSTPELRATMTPNSYPHISDLYNLTEGDLRKGDQKLYEGPDQIAVLDIIDNGDGSAEVVTCIHQSPHWTLAGATLPRETEWRTITPVGDELEFVEVNSFSTVSQRVVRENGRWVVDEYFRGTSGGGCEEDIDVARATYVHNNDPEILLEVTADWIVDPDGKQGPRHSQ